MAGYRMWYTWSVSVSFCPKYHTWLHWVISWGYLLPVGAAVAWCIARTSCGPVVAFFNLPLNGDFFFLHRYQGLLSLKLETEIICNGNTTNVIFTTTPIEYYSLNYGDISIYSTRLKALKGILQWRADTCGYLRHLVRISLIWCPCPTYSCLSVIISVIRCLSPFRDRMDTRGHGPSVCTPRFRAVGLLLFTPWRILAVWSPVNCNADILVCSFNH